MSTTPSTPKPIHAFRAGTHVSLAGEKYSFSEADLAASAAAYDPAVHEAPICIGHPKHDAPAWGWIGGASIQGADLFVTPSQVVPAFAEMHEAGHFKKVSLAFYPPTHPTNPKPGVWYIRHLAFLGAQPPSVKGLEPPEFAAGDEGIVTVEFGEAQRWGWRAVAEVFRGLREWVIADKGEAGLETADRLLPTYLLDEVQRAAEAEVEADKLSASPSYAEPPVPPAVPAAPPSPEFAEQQRQLAERERQLAEREQRLAAQERERHQAQIAAFAEQLEAQGRLLPRERPAVVAILGALGADQRVEFGEGEERFAGGLEEALRKLLADLPVRVDFSERTAPEPQADRVEFAAPDGYAVDAAGAQLHARAVAYQRQHPGTSYDAAVAAIQ